MLCIGLSGGYVMGVTATGRGSSTMHSALLVGDKTTSGMRECG